MDEDAREGEHKTILIRLTRGARPLPQPASGGDPFRSMVGNGRVAYAKGRGPVSFIHISGEMVAFGWFSVWAILVTVGHIFQGNCQASSKRQVY